MSNEYAIELHLQEGKAENYFRAMEKTLGGTIKDHVYSLDKGPVKMHMMNFQLMDKMEMLVFESEILRPFRLHRTPDDDLEMIHINLILEGKYMQSYEEEEVQVEAGSSKGIFLYNGQFPISIELPAESSMRWVGFKLRISELNDVMKDAQKVLSDLFCDEQAVAYHAPMPVYLERLLNDIFQYRDLQFAQKPMIIARGTEVFANLMNTIKQLVANKSLNGLHPEDYKRLVQIKEKLTSEFDKKITVESLAHEFGISESKLKRDFKELFYTSVAQFYTMAKMDEAYRRLKSGEYTVSEVGYDLGYQNLSKFSQMFKKVKGIFPKEVIKLTPKGEE